MECKNCGEKLEHKRTKEDFYEGDSTDVYECPECGETYRKYIPR